MNKLQKMLIIIFVMLLSGCLSQDVRDYGLVGSAIKAAIDSSDESETSGKISTGSRQSLTGSGKIRNEDGTTSRISASGRRIIHSDGTTSRITSTGRIRNSDGSSCRLSSTGRRYICY